MGSYFYDKTNMCLRVILRNLYADCMCMVHRYADDFGEIEYKPNVCTHFSVDIKKT